MTTNAAGASPVDCHVRPQLPALDVPLFEDLRGNLQPSNLSLWKAYMALRQACLDGRPHEDDLARMRELRTLRKTWFDRDEMVLRRAIDSALDLWPNV
jgi:hypothetical protein